jgi:hypothetical protein
MVILKGYNIINIHSKSMEHNIENLSTKVSFLSKVWENILNL